MSASYRANEAYAQFALPLLQTLGASAAVRYSDYSTFGSTTSYKGGFRWQPIEDFALRGTYSTGFRAPNLGELYGLTQFGATLVDPCSGHTVPGDPLWGRSRRAARTSRSPGCHLRSASGTFRRPCRRRA
ncbi:MAG: TonB-dependent receptor [Terriglobales bacterium]